MDVRQDRQWAKCERSWRAKAKVIWEEGMRQGHPSPLVTKPLSPHTSTEICPTQRAHLLQVAQDHVWVGFECLWRRRLHSFSGLPVSLFCHPQSKQAFFLILRWNILCFSLCLLPLVLLLGTTGMSLLLSSWHLLLGYLYALKWHCTKMSILKSKVYNCRKHGTDIKSDLCWRYFSLRMDSSLCAFLFHNSVVSSLTDLKDRKSVCSKQILACWPAPSDCTCSWSGSIKHVPENFLPQKGTREVYNWHLYIHNLITHKDSM